MVPFAPFVTGINTVFCIPHTHCISIARSLYFRNFWAYFLNTFLFPEIAMCVDRHAPFSLTWIFFLSHLLLGMVLSVWTFDVHSLFLQTLIHVHTKVHFLNSPRFIIMYYYYYYYYYYGYLGIITYSLPVIDK